MNPRIAIPLHLAFLAICAVCAAFMALAGNWWVFALDVAAVLANAACVMGRLNCLLNAATDALSEVELLVLQQADNGIADLTLDYIRASLVRIVGGTP